MRIELPPASVVDLAVSQWTVSDPRVGLLLERYCDRPSALRHYGLILWREGSLTDATRAFAAAAALAPDDARVWSDLAGVFTAAGHAAEAHASLETSLELDGGSADVWLRLGSLRTSTGDLAGAEAALDKALAIDPSLVDAKLSLGLVHFRAKRFRRAADLLADGLSASADPAFHACLGEALSNCGDFRDAARAFATALAGDATNAVLSGKCAQAELVAALIDGERDAALHACRASAQMTDTLFVAIKRRCFHLLSAFGHKDAAIWIGVQRLSESPDDLELLYLLPILQGQVFCRAPDRYVAMLFDRFSEEFDHQLVDVLGYQAYRLLVEMIDDHGFNGCHVLDVGCGTGLSGPLLAGPRRHLTGLDLSGGMLKRAGARGCYQALIHDEATTYLEGKDQTFDLVFAADVLIYIGELADLFANVGRALRPGGLFAFTIETTGGGPMKLDVSGRFAHNPEAVRALAKRAGLSLVADRSVDLRWEATGPVHGSLMLMRRELDLH